MNGLIKYQYHIKRNEGNEIVVFEPGVIPVELPSLVYIEGPNSSGKSTLLNLIALGMNGLNRTDIEQSLKSKMQSLMDSSYQNIDFSIEINTGENHLLLTKEMYSQQILSYEIIGEKKKIISPELLEEKYNLIYDIPENPIQRLNELTNAIRDNQKFISVKLSGFREFVLRQLNEIKNSKNPQQIIQDENEIADYKERFNKLKNQLYDKTQYKEILERYSYVKLYRSYLYELNNITKHIDEQESELKKTKKRITFEQDKKFLLAEKYVDELIDIHTQLSRLLTNVISGERDIITLWSKIDFRDILLNKSVDTNAKKTISAVQKLLVDKKKKVISKDKVQQIDMYNKIIELLNSYHNKDTLIPGFNKNISEIIDILKKEYSKYADEVKLADDTKYCIELISEVNKSLSLVETEILPLCLKVNEKSQDYTISETFITQDLKKLYYKKEEVLKKLKAYEKLCSTKAVNLLSNEDIEYAFKEVKNIPDYEDIKYMSEDNLLTKIDVIKEMVEQEEKQLAKLGNIIEFKEYELGISKNRKPHKYQAYVNEVTNIVKACQNLDQKYTTFNKYISKMIDGKLDASQQETNRDNYYEAVSLYLGKKIGIIRHINKIYKVSNVDIINKYILTEEKKIIRYADMGTGQSQCAYLMSKLNSIDNRKVIALFDEVAMMDKYSLEPVFKKLSELYNEGKLIIGIVVQKADSLSIREI